ncbi:MAG: hypothetical protein QXO69_00230 [archaeon]
MCVSQKAVVIKAGKNRATVRILPSGAERDVTTTRPLKKDERVDVFQNVVV